MASIEKSGVDRFKLSLGEAFMKIVLNMCIKVIIIIIVILTLFLAISFIRHKICLSNEKDLLTPL